MMVETKNIRVGWNWWDPQKENMTTSLKNKSQCVKWYALDARIVCKNRKVWRCIANYLGVKWITYCIFHYFLFHHNYHSFFRISKCPNHFFEFFSLYLTHLFILPKQSNISSGSQLSRMLFVVSQNSSLPVNFYFYALATVETPVHSFWQTI